MPLTANDHADLVGLLEQAWGGHNEILTSLLLETADPQKLKRLLLERAKDLGDDCLASQIRVLAYKL